MSEKIELWEIMVPTIRNDGRPIRTRFHRVWDANVLAISGGITILQPAKGQWTDPDDGKLYKERMIPVRIACSREQIENIIDMSLIYYEQIQMMAHRVADEVIIRGKSINE